MTDLRICPCCDGILGVPAHYTLTSACRCGFPDKVTWGDFPERADLEPKELPNGRFQVAA